MNNNSWPERVSDRTAARRAGGRRHYNALRKRKAVDRRHKLLFYWARHPHMSKADLARLLGVHRSTVTRDIQALKAAESWYSECPLCHQTHKTGMPLAAKIEWLSDVQRTYGGFVNRFSE